MLLPLWRRRWPSSGDDGCWLTAGVSLQPVIRQGSLSQPGLDQNGRGGSFTGHCHQEKTTEKTPSLKIPDKPHTPTECWMGDRWIINRGIINRGIINRNSNTAAGVLMSWCVLVGAGEWVDFFVTGRKSQCREPFHTTLAALSHRLLGRADDCVRTRSCSPCSCSC